jgi:hypothetical protein
MADEELRTAIAAYLRACDSTGGEFFTRQLGEEGLERFIDAMVNDNRWGITKMFRMFHDGLGRYPTFEELNPLDRGGPVLVLGDPPVGDIGSE